MLSTANILLTLNNSFNSDEKLNLVDVAPSINAPKNPKLAVVTILDMQAAQLLKKVDEIDNNINKANELSNIIRAGQDTMATKREAIAYMDTIKSQTDPLFKKMQEVFVRVEEIRERVKRHIDFLHRENPLILNGSQQTLADKQSYLAQEQKKIRTEMGNLTTEVQKNYRDSRSALQSIRSVVPEFKPTVAPISVEEETRKPQ